MAALLLTASSLAGPRAGHASLTVALDLPQLTEGAERVVIARVGQVRTGWDSAHKNIISTVDLVVEESLKGTLPANRRLQLVQLGGRIGDLSTRVSGQPDFVPGERAVLFLGGPADRCHLVGLGQGKRPLRLDGEGRWMVDAGDRSSAVLLDRAGGFGHAAPEAPLPLAELRRLVQQSVQSASSEQARRPEKIRS